jgi:hypothetical protein
LKRWLPSSRHLGYMETTESPKYSYKLIRDTCPSTVNSEVFVIAPSDGCPAIANLLRLNASLAIPSRVLRFEVSRLCRRTPVRSVLLTGQTDTHLSDRSSVLRSWTPRNPTREGSKNHHQEQTGTTQPNLEEPRRIIYTYQRGSYKV